MADRLPWFPCYPTKLLGALAGMKAPEGYVYVILLLRIYESGGSCRDDLDALAIRTRLNRRVVSDALDKLFKAGRLVRNGDGIHNPVADTVLADANALRQERKRAGREGGLRSAKKRKENQSNDPSIATASLDFASTKKRQGSTHARVSVLSSSLPLEESLFREEVDEEERSRGRWSFEEFYALYPHKVAKKAARRAFDRVSKSNEVGFIDLIAGLRRYLAKTDDRPWCNPATWLNEGRWQDEPAAPNGAGNGISRNGSGKSVGGSGHRTFASFALARAREASETKR